LEQKLPATVLNREAAEYGSLLSQGRRTVCARTRRCVQLPPPSLRGVKRRSNPSSIWRCRAMDCFTGALWQRETQPRPACGERSETARSKVSGWGGLPASQSLL